MPESVASGTLEPSYGTWNSQLQWRVTTDIGALECGAAGLRRWGSRVIRPWMAGKTPLTNGDGGAEPIVETTNGLGDRNKRS